MTTDQQPSLDADKVPPPRRRPIPSERNRRVYAEVVLAERPQPEVAKEFGISQQRVSQIIDQLQAWLAQTLPEGSEELTPEQQLSLAANTAYLRCQHVYTDALRKLDLSCEDKHSLRIRYAANGEELWRETLRENQSGKSGYLGAALNGVSRQYKLVQMAAGLLGPAMEIFWDHQDAAARQPDRFHCEKSERIVNAAAASGPTAPRSVAPAQPQEEPADEARGLCNLPVRETVDSPLAPAAAAASSTKDEDCNHSSERKFWPQGWKNLRAKSCAAGAGRADQAGSASADPPQAAPDDPGEGGPALAEASWTHPTFSADDRRRRNRQRQKQLARWRASQKRVAG